MASKSDKISAVLPTNSSKKWMLSGIALTALTIVTIASYILGHSIPHGDFQNFIDKLHNISNMNWYIELGCGTLEAISIAFIINGLKRRSIKSTIDSDLNDYVPSSSQEDSGEPETFIKEPPPRLFLTSGQLRIKTKLKKFHKPLIPDTGKELSRISRICRLKAVRRSPTTPLLLKYEPTIEPKMVVQSSKRLPLEISEVPEIIKLEKPEVAAEEHHEKENPAKNDIAVDHKTDDKPILIKPSTEDVSDVEVATDSTSKSRAENPFSPEFFELVGKFPEFSAESKPHQDHPRRDMSIYSSGGLYRGCLTNCKSILDSKNFQYKLPGFSLHSAGTK